MTKRDSAAASRKAWRTRKRMQAARDNIMRLMLPETEKMIREKLQDHMKRDIASGLMSSEQLRLDSPSVQRQLKKFAELLACPDYSGGKK